MKPYVCKVHGEIEPYVAVYTDDRGKTRQFRQCPICKAEKAKQRYVEKKEEVAAYHVDWYAKNRERVLAVSKEYRKSLRQEVIEGYGGHCECCGESHWEFLSVDHVNGGGNQARKTTHKGGMLYRELRRQGFPRDGYRLLCMNCNFAVGKYGYCPHQRKE